MNDERPASRRTNQDLGLGALDMEVMRAQVRRRVLGIEQPARLGRYELRRRLGSGAMGIVYLARDPVLDREVVIKQLHPRIANSSDSARAERRMQREAWAMARLTHPNVVAVYEFGAEGEQFFIAMEYVPGVTLRAWMDAEAERPWPEVLEPFVAAGRGLAAAHEAGLVHRDFKPQNVLFDEAARVAKVTDFGLANSVHELARFESVTPDDTLDAEALSTNGVVLGTPAYMAPECYAGQTADARSDQFSFCVALYEALFGARPFVGSSYTELSRAVRSGQLRPRSGSVPPFIVAALERGLEVDPQRRWPSMTDLLEALCNDPHTRRRRLAAMLVVVAFIGLLASVAALGSRSVRADRIATCAAKGEVIAENWNPSIRARIEMIELDERPELIGQVVLALDEYARQWRDARRDLCVAAEVDHNLEPELARQARQCLDAHRLRMGLLAEALLEYEGRPFWHVRHELVHPPKLTECLDPTHLRGLPELPQTYEQAQREISTALFRAEIERSLHHHEESIEINQAALRDAEELGWPPLIAEAMLELGRAQGRAGRRTLGARSIEDAYFVAIEHDLGAIAVHSATWLAEGSAELAESERWIRQARAALRRIEHPSMELLGDIERVAMVVGLRSGAHERAVEIGEALLPRCMAELGDASPTIHGIRMTLGFAYLEGGRVEDAIASFETLLADEQRWSGTESPMYEPILLALAEAKLAAGDSAEARPLIEEALRSRVAIEGLVSPGVGRILTMLGRAYEDAGLLEAARSHYARDLDIQRQLLGDDHLRVAERHQRQARILLALGERESALEHLATAVGIRVSRAELDTAKALLDAHARAVERHAAGELDDALALYTVALDSHASLVDTSDAAMPERRPMRWSRPVPARGSHRGPPRQRPE